MDFSSLNPETFAEYAEWRNQYVPPSNVTGYLSTHVSPTSALLMTTLMYPPLVLVQGCVLLERSYDPEKFKGWWEHHAGERRLVELSINRLILWDVFDPDSDDDERALELLAERLVPTWRLTVERDFPDRRFDIEISDDYGPTLTLCSAPG